MKLPRVARHDVGGEELVRLLGRYGYQVVRQTGSHMRLVSSFKGSEHRITIPKQRSRLIWRRRASDGPRRADQGAVPAVMFEEGS